MKYKMTLLVAARDINRVMHQMDCSQEGKYFVNLYTMSFSTEKNVNEKYLMTIINMSVKKNEEYTIVGVIFCDVLYTHKDVKILSDGQHEIFIPLG